MKTIVRFGVLLLSMALPLTVIACGGSPTAPEPSGPVTGQFQAQVSTDQPVFYSFVVQAPSGPRSLSAQWAPGTNVEIAVGPLDANATGFFGQPVITSGNSDTGRLSLSWTGVAGSAYAFRFTLQAGSPASITYTLTQPTP